MFKRMLVLSLLLSILNLTSCTDSDSLPLGNGYRISYSYRGAQRSILNNKNSVFVGTHILNYSYDSTFIVAVQRPQDSIKECTYESNETFSVCEEAFNKSTFKQYWIINKKQESVFDEKTARYSNVYGPYNKQTFTSKREELGVPQSLVLKENTLT